MRKAKDMVAVVDPIVLVTECLEVDILPRAFAAITESSERLVSFAVDSCLRSMCAMASLKATTLHKHILDDDFDSESEGPEPCVVDTLARLCIQTIPKRTRDVTEIVSCPSTSSVSSSVRKTLPRQASSPAPATPRIIEDDEESFEYKQLMAKLAPERARQWRKKVLLAVREAEDADYRASAAAEEQNDKILRDPIHLTRQGYRIVPVEEKETVTRSWRRSADLDDHRFTASLETVSVLTKEIDLEPGVRVTEGSSVRSGPERRSCRRRAEDSVDTKLEMSSQAELVTPRAPLASSTVSTRRPFPRKTKRAGDWCVRRRRMRHVPFLFFQSNNNNEESWSTTTPTSTTPSILSSSLPRPKRGHCRRLRFLESIEKDACTF